MEPSEAPYPVNATLIKISNISESLFKLEKLMQRKIDE
jgi:hypothetical protein